MTAIGEAGIARFTRDHLYLQELSCVSALTLETPAATGSPGAQFVGMRDIEDRPASGHRPPGAPDYLERNLVIRKADKSAGTLAGQVSRYRARSPRTTSTRQGRHLRCGRGPARAIIQDADLAR